jgi:hypothetical protein
MPTDTERAARVVKMVQELLLDLDRSAAITPAVIEQKISMVVAMMPAWAGGLNREAVTDELIRRFSLWIGEDTKLVNEHGHQAWLTPSRKKGWQYWQRYQEYLERKVSWKAVEALDRTTDSILGLLEDPNRSGPWDRRGLVVGHVQSGKTGNYSGLICKAADAGYKVIIVLAGLHNNLRAQTQIRLDEAFLGYESAPNKESLKITGVGHIDADPAIRPNYATNRSESGDFSTAVARNLGITPEQRPWLFVVKKNKTVLERLYRWVANHVANQRDPTTGQKTVTHLPLLMIDDEADHASVDTGEQVFNSDGTPDLEHQPTEINRQIRRLLHSFNRSAYVGYTATPFANIFIHERGETREEGPDLFPAAFIVNLGAPSNYIGPVKVFGLQSPTGRQSGLPLVRFISDHEGAAGTGWMPGRHRSSHVPTHVEGVPPSLVGAIDAFILACAVRRLRGDGDKHCSMLIHVTRFKDVQEHVRRQVVEHLQHLKQRVLRRIDHEHVIARLKGLWEADFVPTAAAVRASIEEEATVEMATWVKIEGLLPEVVAEIDVRTINGTAKDVLDYTEHESTGLKVIAIGGDKLSRGLTLEGLSVSYFLRASRLYDTLMQMGRWFGYRPRYLDVCRLYTTGDLEHWFRHITDAAEELREEFDAMAAEGANPREYGLKVQSHSVLMVTSRLKMRNAKSLWLSFSGQLVETVVFFRDRPRLQRNLEAARGLLQALGSPAAAPQVTRPRPGREHVWEGAIWYDQPSTKVVEFLGGYKTHPDAYKVNSLMLAEFISSMNATGELTKWTVAVVGGGKGEPFEIDDTLKVDLLQRDGDGQDSYAIGRLLSPRDEAIDLGETQWRRALDLTRAAWRPGLDGKRPEQPESPNGPAIRRVRGEGFEGAPGGNGHGLLLLYFLDPRSAWTGLPSGTPPVTAFALSFPGSSSGVKVEYKVNNVLWEQQYGSGE